MDTPGAFTVENSLSANGTNVHQRETINNLKKMSSGNVTTGADSCIALKSNMNLLVLGTLCITAVVFLILMSALERRSSFKLHWFNGKFGPVIPLNLLDGYENRFAYSLAFGITTSYCLSIILNDAQAILGERIAAIIKASPSYLSVFFKIIATVVIATGAYPLFVCIGTKHKRFGSCFGLAYSITWFSLFCYKMSKIFKICYSVLTEFFIEELVFELPQYVCLILLMLHFLQKLAFSFKRTFCMGINEQSTWRVRHNRIFQHVKILLQGRDDYDLHEIPKNGFMSTLLAKVRGAMYKPRREFKFSTRIICVFVVCFLVIYMVTIRFINIGLALASPKLLEALNSTIGGLNQHIIEELRTQIELWTFYFYLAVVTSTIKTWLVLLNMLAWYRTHLTRLRQGDRTWLPKSAQKFRGSLSSLTAGSMKLAGYQVAYGVWGYIIFVIVFWIFIGLTATLLIIPLIEGRSSLLLDFLSKIWPAVVISLGIYMAQFLAAKYCFLVQKGKFFSIDNRKAFNIVSFYLFFFNIFLGILSCLLRILKSLVLGILFIERVQKSILPSSFEVQDPGYYAYIGYMLIEHVHANPVLKAFIYLLNESVEDNRIPRSTLGSTQHLLGNTDEDMIEDTRPDPLNRIAKFKMVRNRWNVAYTLIKNPSLVRFRKSQRMEDEDDEGATTESSFTRGSNRDLHNICLEVKVY